MADTSLGATYSKQKSRRDCKSILAIDPHDGGKWDVLVSGTLIEQIKKNQGIGKCLELADTVRWGLLNPRALYRGVRDDEKDIDDDDWLCYVATPPNAYDYRRGTKVRAWPGEVCIICVSDERFVYNWWWVKCCQFNPHLPIGHDTGRFREKVF